MQFVSKKPKFEEIFRQLKKNLKIGSTACFSFILLYISLDYFNTSFVFRSVFWLGVKVNCLKAMLLFQLLVNEHSGSGLYVIQRAVIGFIFLFKSAVYHVTKIRVFAKKTNSYFDVIFHQIETLIANLKRLN